MSFTLAVSGKGGTGKTTICALITRYLNERFKTPILAIDADANANFNDVLGVKIEQTIGTIREKTKVSGENLPGGMTKIEYLDLMINQSLVEGSNIDLLIMGRPEGSGCYCAANHLIRRAIDQLSNKYDFVVIDNEAGMEHLSRHTTENVDLLLIVSDASWRGLKSTIRIKNLVDELDLNIKKQMLIINKAPENLSEKYLNEIRKNNMSFLGTLPEDEIVTRYDEEGIPLIQLASTSKIVTALYKLLDSLPWTLES